jgi:hypothetical protein
LAALAAARVTAQLAVEANLMPRLNLAREILSGRTSAEQYNKELKDAKD